MIEKVRTRSILLMIAHSLVIGGNAGAHLVLASVLDPEIYGSVFFFLTLLNFVLMFSMFGFQHVIMHQAPRMEEQKNYQHLNDLVFGSWTVCVITSMIVMACVGLWHFCISPINMPGASGAILCLFIIAPLWAFLKIALPFLLSRGATFSGVIPDQGFQALGLIMVPIVAYLGWVHLDDVFTILAGQVIAGVLGVAVTFHYVRQYFSQMTPYKFSFVKPIKDWKSLNIPFFIFSVMQQAVQRSDLLLLGFLGGPKNLAIYAISLKIAQVLNFPAMASKAALAPRFSSLFEKNDQKKLNGLLISSTLSLSLIGLAAGGALYFISPFILNLIGKVYVDESLKILLVLIIAEIFVCIFTPLKIKALMGTSQKFLSLIFSIGLLVSVALNLYFIPTHGIMAVALIRLMVMFLIHALILLNMRKINFSNN